MHNLQFLKEDSHPSEEVERIIKLAIEIGYRLVDTASFYNNEAPIGKALKEIFEEGRVKREDLFIISKVGANSYSKMSMIKPYSRLVRPLNFISSYGTMTIDQNMCYQQSKNPCRICNLIT